ncbi:hypothetical protein TcWFU_001858 [Taenia crassiceps]|uniref:Uncharacterized protein n=1 Tax=Taenia crassiceps TaxID=6207 RepID=A0ABR4Q582_9CEST
MLPSPSLRMIGLLECLFKWKILRRVDRSAKYLPHSALTDAVRHGSVDDCESSVQHTNGCVLVDCTTSVLVSPLSVPTDSRTGVTVPYKLEQTWSRKQPNLQ